MDNQNYEQQAQNITGVCENSDTIATVQAQPKPKKLKKVIIIIVAACILIAGAIAVAVTVSKKNAEKRDIMRAEEVAEISISMYSKGFAPSYFDCFHEKKIESLAKKSYMSVSYYKDYMSKGFLNFRDELKSSYGDDYTVTTRVLSSKKVTGSKYTQFKREYKENYGLTISDARDVEIEYTLSGSRQKSTHTISVYVIKIGSKWYCYDVL